MLSPSCILLVTLYSTIILLPFLGCASKVNSGFPVDYLRLR